MTANWLLYSLLIGGLMTLAGWQASRAAGLVRRGARWAWLLAGVSTVLFPLVALVPPSEPAARLGPVWTLPALPRGEASSLPPTEADFPIPFRPAGSLLWIGLSTVALGWVIVSQRRLALERCGWRRTKLQGVPVRLSEDFGPAVVGILRPEIVLPDWATRLPAGQLALILEHEREHLRKHDSRLLGLMLALVILMPWQVFLWIQLAGLRLAIELDCDNRVVRNGSEPEMYGELLLNLAERVSGRRMSAGSIPLLPFSGGRSPLERRIRALAGKRPTRLIAALGLTIATMAVGLACAAVPPASATSKASATASTLIVPTTPAEQKALRQELAKYFPLQDRTVYRQATSLGFILGLRPIVRIGPQGDGC